MMPMFGSRKMFMMDECHQITGPAMEALLKLLEEPPKHVFFALCTSEPERIKPIKAIRRRCQETELRPLTRGQTKKLLERVLEKEGAKDFPVEVTRKIIGSCWGSAGQALAMLDSVIDMTSVDKAVEALENLVVSEESVTDLVKLLLDNKITGNSKWEQVRKKLEALDQDPEKVRHAILTYMGKVMIGKGMDVKLMKQMSMFMDSFMYTGKAGLILACAFCCQASD
jgi:DNA polymerase III gamma/tau subunit